MFAIGVGECRNIHQVIFKVTVLIGFFTLAADCSTNRVQTVPACPQVDRRSSARVYLKNHLTAVADIPSRSALREAMKGNFVVPRTRLKLGEMAFSVAAQQAWNLLPTDLKTLRSTPAFKRSLKTFLFRTAYNV